MVLESSTLSKAPISFASVRLETHSFCSGLPWFLMLPDSCCGWWTGTIVPPSGGGFKSWNSCWQLDGNGMDRKDMEMTSTKNVSVKRLSNSILWIILCFQQVALSPHFLALWCRLGYFHSYAFVDLDPIWTPGTKSRVERRDGVHLVGGTGKKRLTLPPPWWSGRMLPSVST